MTTQRESVISMISILESTPNEVSADHTQSSSSSSSSIDSPRFGRCVLPSIHTIDSNFSLLRPDVDSSS